MSNPSTRTLTNKLRSPCIALNGSFAFFSTLKPRDQTRIAVHGIFNMFPVYVTAKCSFSSCTCSYHTWLKPILHAFKTVSYLQMREHTMGSKEQEEDSLKPHGQLSPPDWSSVPRNLKRSSMQGSGKDSSGHLHVSMMVKSPNSRDQEVYITFGRQKVWDNHKRKWHS